MGAQYRHFKGGIYELLLDATLERDAETEMVVYRNVETGKRWIRPKAEFFGTTDDGQPRFVLMDDVVKTLEDIRDVAEDADAAAVIDALKKHKGCVSVAARALGMSRWRLYRLIRKYELRESSKTLAVMALEQRVGTFATQDG